MKKNKMIVQNKKKSDLWLALAFLVPSIILFIMFCYYPFAKTIINSFAVTDSTGEFIRWNGLTNWKRVLTNKDFLQTLGNTFKYAGLDFVMSFSVSILFAILSAKAGKHSKLYQTLYALPMVLAAAPVASIWLFIYREHGGLLNQLLGTSTAWIKSTETALVAVAVSAAWGHVAGRFLVLLAGFRNVSNDLIEASMIDGAGWWARTFKIMIPMASPQIFYVLFTSIIGAFKTFSQIKLLTGGGPVGSTTTLMVSIYEKASINGQIQSACCLSLILFVIIFIATRIQFLFEKKMVFYQ